MEICTMYIKTRNSVLINFSFRNEHGMANKKVLIDSGAMDNFINQETAKWLGVE